MTRLLAIDTTGDMCSLALKDGDQTHQFHQCLPRQHARQVLPQLEALFAEAGWSKTSLDAVVYGRGPGSFTGIRIAAGIAQGIALGSDCGIIPVSTLQTLAMEAVDVRPEVHHLWVALDARMRELYFARYSVVKKVPQLAGDETLLTTAQLPPAPDESLTCDLLLVGNGWQTEYGFNPQWLASLARQKPCLTLPKAIWGAALAEVLLAQDPAVRVAPELALPIYLRDKVTWDKKPKVGQ